MKHPHHDVIVAWAADPTQCIEYRTEGGHWHPIHPSIVPGWCHDHEYRLRPPQPEYPKSTISDEALRSAWPEKWGAYFHGGIARAIADSAIAHEFETGAAVPKADHLATLGEFERAARTLIRAGYTDKHGEVWEPPAATDCPRSSMSDEELGKAYNPQRIWSSKSARNVADTALRVEFEKGTIITKAEHQRGIDQLQKLHSEFVDRLKAEHEAALEKKIDFDEMERRYKARTESWAKECRASWRKEREAREIAIASAVQAECNRLFKTLVDMHAVDLDLPALIATVK